MIVFEDVYAAERAKQYVVSNIGDHISAKRIKAEAEAEQHLGQESESKCSFHHDRGTVKKRRERTSSASIGVKELHQSGNLISLEDHTGIHGLKNLLLLIMLVIFLRSA